ncbi:MAG: hypothetical protein RL410_1200 [Actinomycetota bacterium]|jgi:hypothetical protein
MGMTREDLSVMALRIRVVTAAFAAAAVVGTTLAMSPAFASEATPTYISSVDQAVAEVTQILASGDTIGGYTWPGTPDGMGAVKNSDGTVTVFVTHEFSASDAFVGQVERSYGGFGSTITAVTYNTETHSVVKIEDAIKNAKWYDYVNGTWGDSPAGPVDAPDTDVYGTANHTTAINRFCSATLMERGTLAFDTTKRVKYYVKVKKNGKIVKVAKYKNVPVHYGYKEPIFFTGEEGESESRDFGLNTKTGELVQLAALGLGATENINIAPASATKKTTVALMGEDGAATDSQLFMYKGTKTTQGTWYERAGLTNGLRYVARVLNSGANVATDLRAREVLADRTVSTIKRGFAVNGATITIADGVATITTAAAHNLKVGDTVTLAGFATVAFDADENIATADLQTDPNGNNTVSAIASTTSFQIQIDGNDAGSTATSGTVALPTDEIVVTAAAASTAPAKIALASNVVTITTATQHHLRVGDQVVLAGFDNVGGVSVNGTQVVTVVGSNVSFSFAKTGGTDAAEATIVNGTVTAGHLLNEGDTVNFAGVTGDALVGRYTVSAVPATSSSANSPTVFRVTAKGGEATSLNLTGGIVNKVLDVEWKKVSTDIDGEAQQTIAKLRGTAFARIEDGVFDPNNANVFYFITTQSDSETGGYQGVKTSTRDGGALWKLTFVNVTHPELGASLELVLTGAEAPANDPTVAINKIDNIGISADGQFALIQEDPGVHDQLSRVLAIRFLDKKLVSIAKFNNDLFNPSSVNTYITNDEESSGVFDATKLLRSSGADTASYFFFNTQIHPVTVDGSGNSLGTDPLKVRANALLRPDLLTQTSLTITHSKHVAAATTATATVSDLGALAVNDIVTIWGADKTLNGTYAVTAIDAGAKTFTYAVKGTAATVDTDITGRVAINTTNGVDTGFDADLNYKKAVIEGGALYTLKIASWQTLFELS